MLDTSYIKFIFLPDSRYFIIKITTITTTMKIYVFEKATNAVNET
jgi:hypothetical protein